MNYEHPVDCLRETSKKWMAESVIIRCDAIALTEKASLIYDRAIDLDLLADKIERATTGGAA